MSYKVDTKAAGSKPSAIGNTRGQVVLNDKIFAGLETPTAFNTVEDVANTDYSVIQGMWSRHTTLKKGDTWKVSAVVGLIAQDGKQSSKNIRETQKRRSFLAYSERERAVLGVLTPATSAGMSLTSTATTPLLAESTQT